MASIVTLGHPNNSDYPSMKQTLHALMMADFMTEISRMRLENAINAGK
jgi:hypothetical protein